MQIDLHNFNFVVAMWGSKISIWNVYSLNECSFAFSYAFFFGLLFCRFPVQVPRHR